MARRVVNGKRSTRGVVVHGSRNCFPGKQFQTTIVQVTSEKPQRKERSPLGFPLVDEALEQRDFKLRHATRGPASEFPA
jgi:hypothetical protein